MASDAYAIMEDEVFSLREQLKVSRSEAVFHRDAVKELEAVALREHEKVAALIEACKEWVKIRGDGCGLKCGECFHPTGHSSNCLLRPIKSALAAFDAPPEGGKP